MGRWIRTFGWICAGVLYGQTAQQPRFDVASVKPGDDVFSTRPNRSVGRIRWITDLCHLIGYAYRLDPSHVTGRSCGVVYELEATFDPAATDDQVRLMVQSLLTERFKMQSHHAAREAEGYGLVIARGGHKLREAKDGEEPPPLPAWIKDTSPTLRAQTYISAAGGHENGVTWMTGRRVSMSQLADTLERALGAPVWNRTGLPGNYYFGFRYRHDPANPETDAPSLTTAVQESLGLRLEKQKGLVKTLVIDSIGPPSEN
jgi:uncharacterized protein (TIGR03435 family)